MNDKPQNLTPPSNDPGSDPADVRQNFDSMSPTSRRRSLHAEHGSRRRRSQRLMLALALGVALLLLVVVIAFSTIRIRSLAAANDTMNAELFQAKQELAKVAPALEQARKELANMTQGRLPHLRALVPDKVIDVNSGYVKNIVFTLLRSNSGTRYEYRVVMENKTDSLIRPDVRVFVFDHRGVQVGMGDVADRSDMIPGESRSYSAAIERFMDEEPHYFYVWTRTKK